MTKGLLIILLNFEFERFLLFIVLYKTEAAFIGEVPNFLIYPP